MSGETQRNESGWSTDTLKDYLEKVIALNDTRYNERWSAQEAATKYSQEKANEFRGALDDVSSKQATKVELATAVKTLSDKIDVSSTLIAELRSRLDVGNPAIAALQNQNSRSQGQDSGSDKTWAVIGKVVPILIGLGGLLYGIFK